MWNIIYMTIEQLNIKINHEDTNMLYLNYDYTASMGYKFWDYLEYYFYGNSCRTLHQDFNLL